MITFVAVLLFIIAISILVIFHEFGHFITAKFFGMRAEKFYLFFNPKFSIIRMKKFNGKIHFKFFSANTAVPLRQVVDSEGDVILDEKGKPKLEAVPTEELTDDDWSKYPNNTEYGIGWIPFGGFVKIAGMIDESMDIQSMKKEPEKWEFRAKPAWQRFIVITAGVVMNVIIGVAIFSFSHLIFAKQYIPIENVKEGIYAYPYAQYLGFQTGDMIVQIDDTKIERKEDIVANNGFLSTKIILAKKVIVSRNGIEKEINIPDTLFSYYRKGNLFIGFDNVELNIDSVMPESNAQIAGITKSTKIISVNDEKIFTYGQFKEILNYNKATDLQFVVKKGENIDTLTVRTDSLGKIGFILHFPKYEMRDYNVLSSIKFGWVDAFEAMMSNIKGFGKIFSGQLKASESLSGPLGILLIFKQGIGYIDGNLTIIWEFFWKLTAIFSMALAFMNILPLPALDGGYALFILIEAITRRKFSDKFMTVANYIGLFLLIALMIYATGNDIMRIFK
ncbi:MAG: RIP metalloprotease RseP [Bacteroidales bacterium]|jgi:regulator of sigma E protease|nr:RIP metalloprotease RseP [Bacteroidales bacterium]